MGYVVRINRKENSIHKGISHKVPVSALDCQEQYLTMAKLGRKMNK